MSAHLINTFGALIFVIVSISAVSAPLVVAIYLESIGRNVAANTVGIGWIIVLLFIICYAVTA